MQIVVVGAGPVGLFCGLNFARRGHAVTVLDRDPCPPRTGEWQRHSMMQFRHPHYFRPIVCQVLLESLPDVWDAAVAAGGVPGWTDGWPKHIHSFSCRRATFERAMWTLAAAQDGLTIRRGFAHRVLADADRVRGVVVDGSVVDADVVIVAAGRTSHFADAYRAPAQGGPCGHAYITRMYRTRDGVTPPSRPRPILEYYRGYLAALVSAGRPHVFHTDPRARQ
jgi:2-polyprenyl-6-methoxyphenol hydroxylase-like FAD-dependent oxidoreductase